MAGAAVVEPRLDLGYELHGPAGYPQEADEPVPVGGRALDHRHEVENLADTVRGHEPGDEHCGVGHVQLLGDVAIRHRQDPEIATFLRIKKRREHTRRVEARTAEE